MQQTWTPSRPPARSGEQKLGTLRLKGWPAVVAIVLVGIFLLYRATSARSALEGEQGELLRNHLRGEYAGHVLPDVKQAYDAGDTEELEAQVDRVTSLGDIQFTSVGVKGTGDEVIVKLTISVGGKAPPDGKTTRYYLLRHRTIGGWRVVREVGSWSWYLKLF
jgi:hypothetical protein